MAAVHIDKVKHTHLIAFIFQQTADVTDDFALLSSGLELFFEKAPKYIVASKVNQAISAFCKAIASSAIRGFTISSYVCFALSAGIALTTKIVPPIFSTKKPVFISTAVITSLRKNMGVRFQTPILS